MVLVTNRSDRLWQQATIERVLRSTYVCHDTPSSDVIAGLGYEEKMDKVHSCLWSTSGQR